MDPVSWDMHGWYCGTPLLGCYFDAAYSLGFFLEAEAAVELVGSSEGERATWEMLSDDDGAFLISTLSREEPEGGEQVGELYTVEVRGEKLLSYNYYYGILLEAATAIVW